MTRAEGRRHAAPVRAPGRPPVLGPGRQAAGDPREPSGLARAQPAPLRRTYWGSGRRLLAGVDALVLDEL